MAGGCEGVRGLCSGDKVLADDGVDGVIQLVAVRVDLALRVDAGRVGHAAPGQIGELGHGGLLEEARGGVAARRVLRGDAFRHRAGGRRGL